MLIILEKNGKFWYNIYMDKIRRDIIKCKLCGDLPKLVDNNIQIGTTRFVIIGESPAKDGWIQSHKAFYNTAGKLQASGRVLEKLLKGIGLTIEDIYFTECCKCIIEDRKILPKCSSNCLPILSKQLKDLPCDIVVTMGLAPTQVLLGYKVNKFADVVGKVFNIELGGKKYLLLPIYHPSPLNPKGYKNNVPIFEKLGEITKE